MNSARRSDSTPRKRRASHTELDRSKAIKLRTARKRFLIICEGTTEKNYFTGMRTRGGPQLEVDETKWDQIGAVSEAGKRAATAARSGDPYDEVWCAIDTELQPRIVFDAERAAEINEVSLAFSSPSFDLWLILHIEFCAHTFMSAADAKRQLRRLRPAWTESSTNFEDFSAGLKDAIDRAKALDPTGNNYRKNPSTSAWKLVEAIMS